MESSPELYKAFNEALSLAPSPEPEFMSSQSSIESLPYELIEQIARAVCRSSPNGPPATLLNLLVLSRRFYDVLGPRNEGFYAELFRERFDWKSAERRWSVVSSQLRQDLPFADNADTATSC